MYVKKSKHKVETEHETPTDGTTTVNLDQYVRYEIIYTATLPSGVAALFHAGGLHTPRATTPYNSNTIE